MTKIYVERVSSRPYYRSKTKPNEKKPVLREGVACRENCQRYPCFKGIESIISNLAMTCHEFKGETNEQIEQQIKDLKLEKHDQDLQKARRAV